tara:strand:- start:3537 stop:4046 length:510 start_codon:yes stop_codon:yes gene_type:complete
MKLLKEIRLLKIKALRFYKKIENQEQFNNDILNSCEFLEKKIKNLENKNSEILKENKVLKLKFKEIIKNQESVNKLLISISNDVSLLSIVISKLLSGKPYNEVIIEIQEALMKEEMLARKINENFEEDYENSLYYTNESEEDYDIAEDEFYLEEEISSKNKSKKKKVYH